MREKYTRLKSLTVYLLLIWLFHTSFDVIFCQIINCSHFMFVLLCKRGEGVTPSFSVCFSRYLLVHSLRFSTKLLIFLSVCFFSKMSVSLPSIYQFVYLSISLFVHLSIIMSVCSLATISSLHWSGLVLKLTVVAHRQCWHWTLLF